MNLIAHIAVRGFHIPSFKNHKHSNRQGHVYCDSRVKGLMTQLESGILSALYSSSPTNESVTDSVCLKPLRTALSGLSDDSLREIPEAAFSHQVVPKGQEGVVIEIYEL